MTDYLSNEDKNRLKKWGYTPYKGEYGYVWEGVGYADGRNRIVAHVKAHDEDVWVIVHEDGTTGWNDGESMADNACNGTNVRNTLAPDFVLTPQIDDDVDDQLVEIRERLWELEHNFPATDDTRDMKSMIKHVEEQFRHICALQSNMQKLDRQVNGGKDTLTW
jgi:hypothetical protein